MRIVLNILLVIFFSVSTYAQSVEISATVDTNTILIGDWIRLNLQAKYTSDIVLTWPQFADTIDAFDVVDRLPIDTQQSGNLILQSQQIIITAFDSGYHILKPIQFYFTSGQTLDSAGTDPFLITVHTLQVDTSLALKPIKGPMEVGWSFEDILPYLLILLLIILIGVGIFYWYKKSKQKAKPIEKPKPKAPPHVIALAKLKQTEEEKLWQKGEIKEYYSRISDIVREYIEFRFEKPALESTTSEILESLVRVKIEPSSKAKLKELLSLSDFVKFAKIKPLPDEHEKTMQQVMEFVKETKQEAVVGREEAVSGKQKQ